LHLEARHLFDILAYRKKAQKSLYSCPEIVSPYAAAARATDLTNLPPACIPTGALDLFVDENIQYAQRLIQAGVPTELHVYPGAFHGFDIFAPSAMVSKQFKADRDSALRRALHDSAR